MSLTFLKLNSLVGVEAAPHIASRGSETDRSPGQGPHGLPEHTHTYNRVSMSGLKPPCSRLSPPPFLFPGSEWHLLHRFSSDRVNPIFTPKEAGLLCERARLLD